MGQYVHMGRKISYIAAQAASTIVNCQLSIVNFLGFATGSIYLDTSIPNHLFANDKPDWMSVTWRFWDRCIAGEFEIFLSDVFFDELELCREPKLGWMYEKLELLQFNHLKKSREVEQLAQDYLDNGLLSEQKLNDRLHIAFAVVYDCDVILSWNFSDIVKDSTRGTVKIVNAVRRYKEIQILSPEQFLEEASR
jgi:predicted nucleic acid-binding protein